MSRTVRLMPRAKADLKGAYRWAARHAPYTAERWFARFQEALSRLAQTAERHALASEQRLWPGLRQMLFGRKPNVFRVLFAIEGDLVNVLRIRRASRRRLRRRDLDDPSTPVN